jgi:uncharacterized protein
MNTNIPEETFRNYNFQHNQSNLEPIYDFHRKNLTPNMNKINFVVSHGKCSDGFMSATIVRMYLKKIGVDLTTVTFYNAYYGCDFSQLPDMMRDKHVVICDFSFPKFLFDKMVEATNGNILILDHHKTAQKSLQDVPPEYLVFDMNHSGAFITWTYFFGFDNIPKAVLYVEDNDIWTKKLPQTREFTAYMFSREFDFEEYEKFFNDTYLIEQAFPIGKGMVLQNNANLGELTKSCIPQFIQTPDKRYNFVACVNSAGLLRSDLGNFVLTKYKNANLSMVYSHNQYTGGTSISYRSLDDRSDTTEVAKLTGGGGHRNASGTSFAFKIDTPPPARVIDQYRAYFMLDELYEVDINGPCGKKKFLAINTSIAKRHLVKYLLQERYINDEGLIKNKQRTENNLPGYQEGMFCMRNRLNDPTYDCAYDGAYVWHYDGLTNMCKMTLKVRPNVFSPGVLEDMMKENCYYKIIDMKDGLYEIEIPSKTSPEHSTLHVLCHA